MDLKEFLAAKWAKLSLEPNLAEFVFVNQHSAAGAPACAA